jgi:hypothetical protein
MDRQTPRTPLTVDCDVHSALYNTFNTRLFINELIRLPVTLIALAMATLGVLVSGGHGPTLTQVAVLYSPLVWGVAGII